MIRAAILAGALVCLASAGIAFAQPPSPISPTLHGFPGSMPGPSSAITAGLALADRWLGDEPAGNPASSPTPGVVISPALVRMSRQDLAARNRNFDQQAAFLDGAGGSIGVRAGALALLAYAWHPVLRREDNVFERGPTSGPSPPAVVRSDASMREMRAGVGASFGAGRIRVGAAGEWTRREDTYHTVETSGGPDAGERTSTFKGEAVGFQAGARLDHGGTGPGAFTIGVAARFVPALTLEGEQTLALGTGTTVTAIAGERESGWEGGVSGRVVVTPTFRVLAGAGGRTAQQWSGFDAASGDGFGWSVGFDYHQPEEPWTARLGIGTEQQSGVPESRAIAVGFGFRWNMGDTTLDVGALRRTLDRADVPSSFDDRLVGSITVAF